MLNIRKPLVAYGGSLFNKLRPRHVVIVLANESRMLFSKFIIPRLSLRNKRFLLWNAQTEYFLYVFSEKRTPSSPADRADRRFMDWFQKFGPAAQAAIEMFEEVDAAKYGERSTRLGVLTPEDLAALSDETLDIAADNLEDLATQVNEARLVIEDLQQERAEAAQQVAEAAGG